MIRRLWIALALALVPLGAFGQTITRSPLPYASGSFTPTVTFATPGDLSVSYAAQTGTYVRVGQMVLITVTLTFTPTYTTASGAFTITSLPYTITGTPTAAVADLNSSFAWPGSTDSMVVVRQTSSTGLKLYGMKTAGNGSNFTTTNLPTGSQFIVTLSMIYQTPDS